MSTSYASDARDTSPAADAALLIGRIVLIVMFVFSGVGKFMDIAGTAGYIASKGLPMPSVLAAAAGLAEVAGGLMIAIGWQTRIAALGLLVYTVLAAYFFHDFWHLPEGGERMSNMIHFLKNMSIAGAFLMLAGVGPGRFALDGRSGA